MEQSRSSNPAQVESSPVDLSELELKRDRAELPQAELDQHFLRDIEKYKSLLESLDLSTKTVHELGVGTGVLTELILAQNPEKVIGYECESSLVPEELKQRIDLKAGDFSQMNLEGLAAEDACLIMNPPYNQLGFIRHNILERHPDLPAVMLIPATARDDFPDFEVALSLPGEAFDPPSKGEHLVVRRGFEIKEEYPSLMEVASSSGVDTDQYASDKELIDDVLIQIRRRLLNPNPGEQLGTNRRVVLLLTNNMMKVPETKRNLARYGIEAYQIPRVDHPDYINAILSLDIENVRIKAVARETTKLFKRGTTELADGEHLEAVDHASRLIYHFKKDGVNNKKVVEHTTPGYIDRARQLPSGRPVFGWDDIFVVDATRKSYQELVEMGYKVSSRDMVWARYLQDQIYYSGHQDLAFRPQNQNQTIDFHNSVAAFIEADPYLTNSVAEEIGVANVFRHVADEGTFFRSPINRREKNYWLPGLNGGVPLVKKKDAIHEITFMAHDFGHMLIPDLIIAGDLTPHEKRVAIGYRMMSEAITLVLADMAFIDTLKRSGVEYDFSKRKIYPLFEALGLDLTRDNIIDNLKTIMHANMEYCLKGNDSRYRSLLEDAGSSDEALVAFQEKYKKFFVEDFRWTERNMDNMLNQSAASARWWETAGPVAKKYSLGLQTVQEYARDIPQDPDEMLEAIFERVFTERVAPAFERPTISVLEPDRRTRAFVRYMLGQASIFEKFGHVPEASAFRDDIIKALDDGLGDPIDPKTMYRIREHYNRFVDLLLEQNWIQHDDASTYREVFPLFSPFYVFYDEDDSFYETLPEISNRILGV